MKSLSLLTSSPTIRHRSVMSRTYRSILFITVLATSSVFAQLSSSHISAHLINAYTAGSSNIIDGHPRVLKILDLGGDMLAAARAYKAGTPGGKIVLRIYTPVSYPNTSDPGTSATNFWTTV